MGRAFTGGQNSTSSRTGVITAPPCSISIWVNMNSLSGDGVAASVGSTASNNACDLVHYSTFGVFRAEAVSGGADDDTAVTSAALSTGSWNHLCAVWASSTSRTCYLNGANAGSSAVSSAVVSLTNLVIGALNYNSAGLALSLNGSVAQCGYWNLALTAADVLSLSKGFSPLKIRPSGLVSYAPLLSAGVERDLKGGTFNDPVCSFTPGPRTYGL